MRSQFFLFSLWASLALTASISKREKRVCSCPNEGPEGTCEILLVDGKKPDSIGSAQCKGGKAHFICPGTFNGPNCNACAQTVQYNFGLAGRGLQCDGDRYCSKDEGNKYYICKANEKPYVPSYSTEISFATDDSIDHEAAKAAVIADDKNDMNWFKTTLPQWLDSVCYGSSCLDAPTKVPEQELIFHKEGEHVAQRGKLSLHVSEAQFRTVDEFNVLVDMAVLSIVQTAKCDKILDDPNCWNETLDDGHGGHGDHLHDGPHRPVGRSVCVGDWTSCSAPADVNVRMMKDGNPHAFLHFQLNWKEEEKKVDCERLNQISEVTEWGAGLKESWEIVGQAAGAIKLICGLIESGVNSKNEDEAKWHVAHNAAKVALM